MLSRSGNFVAKVVRGGGFCGVLSGKYKKRSINIAIKNVYVNMNYGGNIQIPHKPKVCLDPLDPKPW